jgi:flavin reductase (DIM6/NTAB) family NADH-FMN oxidoreductase RutF
VEINPKSQTKAENYKLLIGSVVPRPIAFITTVGEDGVVNAAPFSFFNVVATDPPMVAVTIMRKPDGLPKDTARNILASRDYVIQVVDERNVEAVNHTSCDYPPHVSEIEPAGLTTVKSEIVSAPRIKEAKIHMECQLRKHLELGNGPNSDLIIGEIIHFQVDDSLYENGKINVTALAPVGRLAGSDYVTLGELFSKPRPSYQHLISEK